MAIEVDAWLNPIRPPKDEDIASEDVTEWFPMALNEDAQTFQDPPDGLNVLEKGIKKALRHPLFS